MPLYSFRAECRLDLDSLIDLLAAARVPCSVRTSQDSVFPDVDVEIETDVSIETLKQFMAEVEDGHRMVDTLELAPFPQTSAPVDNRHT